MIKLLRNKTYEKYLKKKKTPEDINFLKTFFKLNCKNTFCWWGGDVGGWDGDTDKLYNFTRKAINKLD